ncbi:MAG: HEAT repeat domain-containing protein [Planctomycetes bacterium]|nr:HEAT repeat domain-containing protein [Planctomycetota bacterium]
MFDVTRRVDSYEFVYNDEELYRELSLIILEDEIDEYLLTLKENEIGLSPSFWLGKIEQLIDAGSFEDIGGIDWHISDAGIKALPILPDILILLEHENREVRKSAAMIVGTIGSAEQDAVYRLSEHLYDAEYMVRVAVLRSLGQIGPAAQSVSTNIAKIAGNREELWTTRMQAIISLSEIGPYSVASTVLKESIYDHRSDIRSTAIYAVSNLGDFAASEFAPILAEALIDPKNVEPDINGNWPSRSAALTLASFGPLAKLAISALSQTLSLECAFSSQRRDACELNLVSAFALSEIVQEGDVEALDELQKAIHDFRYMKIDEISEDSEFIVAEFAIVAIGKIGPLADASLPTLSELANIDEGNYGLSKEQALRIRAVAMDAIREIDRD